MENLGLNYLVVSDLHLSEGFRSDTGKWSPNEDFLVDSAFAEFLLFHQNNRPNHRPWKLIVAGDGFDFLQVTRIPARNPNELRLAIEAALSTKRMLNPREVADSLDRAAKAKELLVKAVEYMKENGLPEHDAIIASVKLLEDWIDKYLMNFRSESREVVWDLERLVHEVWILALRKQAQLTKSETTYGLGTTWPEAVWKLDRISEGHTIFFSALAWFLDCGNSLVFIKGNHDVDLYWPQVQNRMKELLQDAHLNFQMCDPSWKPPHVHVELSMKDFRICVENQMFFEDWIFFEEDLLYVEHGNQYELFDFFDDFQHPTIPDRDQYLALPAGSFFVRYFFNRIEASFPFADNLRPISRFITWAFQNRLREAINLIWNQRSGLSKFIYELVKRSFRDYKRQREDAKVREELRKSSFEASPKGQIKTIYEVDYALMGSAKGKLTLKHLDEINELAHRTRTGPLDKILHSAVVLFPILILIFIIIGVLLLPGIWASKMSITALGFAGNYLIMMIFMGLIMRLLFEFIAPWLTSVSEEEDYLRKAAEHIWKILQTPVKSQGPPLVKYLVFGHTHDPNMCRLGEESEAPWYVNTGSWLHRIDEVESWDRLDRDFTYLSIIADDDPLFPGLYRWDTKAGRPERIRRREVVPYQ